MMEKMPQSQVNTFIAPDEQSKKDLENYYTEKHRNQEELRALSREKTPEEVKLINELLNNLSSFITEYGGISKPISLDNIHLLDEQKLTPELKKKLLRYTGSNEDQEYRHAVFHLDKQAIYIAPQSHENFIALASSLVHELMYYNSYTSIQLDLDDPRVEAAIVRRSGFFMLGTDRSHFHDIDEGLVETLTKMFAEKYFTQTESLKKAYTKRDQNKILLKQKVLNLVKAQELTFTEEEIDQLLDEINYFEESAVKESDFVDPDQKYHKWAYKEERDYLRSLMDDLCAAHPQKFASRDDVLKMFTKAFFTGRLLELARIIKETYGKDMLRKIAHPEDLDSKSSDSSQSESDTTEK